MGAFGRDITVVILRITHAVAMHCAHCGREKRAAQGARQGAPRWLISTMAILDLRISYQNDRMLSFSS